MSYEAICTGTIEVSIATMKKQDRAKVSEVYISGFVPSYLLPNKCAISLDPFLEPLVTELEERFVNGTKITFIICLMLNNHFRNRNATVAGIPPGRAVIRCLLLLWTGDYPAQAEIGKFIQSGIKPCRRCSLKGTTCQNINVCYLIIT